MSAYLKTKDSTSSSALSTVSLGLGLDDGGVHADHFVAMTRLYVNFGGTQNFTFQNSLQIPSCQNSIKRPNTSVRFYRL